MKIYNCLLSGLILAATLNACSEHNPYPEPDETIREITGLDPIEINGVGFTQPLPTVESISITEADKVALRSLTDFTFDLNSEVANAYQLQFNQTNGNYSISPLSAMLCMSMFANSVDEQTGLKIAQMLGCRNLQSLNELSTKLIKYLPSSTNGIDMVIANSVWYSNLYEASHTFKQTMTDTFGATILGLDFSATSAEKTVNEWCSSMTKGKIPTFLQDIPTNTIAIWLNALYFAGEWNDKFNKDNTKKETFFGSKNQSTVDMMHIVDNTKYTDCDGFYMTTRPFCGEEYEVAFILPHEGMDIEEASKKLTADTYNKLRENIKDNNCIVYLALPKFEIETTASLKEIYSKMGFPMQEAELTPMGIDANVNFSNITIQQASTVSFDEDGAKMTAATSVSYAGDSGIEPQKVHMDCNRPFFFIVSNKSTDAIVMMGRINNLPNAD